MNSMESLMTRLSSVGVIVKVAPVSRTHPVSTMRWWLGSSFLVIYCTVDVVKLVLHRCHHHHRSLWLKWLPPSFSRNILHCRRRQVGSPQVSPSSPVSVVEMVATKDHFTVEGMDAPCAIMFDMSHSVCRVHLHKRDVNWRRHKGKATSLVTKIQSLLTVLINILRTFLDTHFSYSLVLKYAFKGGDHQQLNYTQARQSCMTFSSRLISARHLPLIVVPMAAW